MAPSTSGPVRDSRKDSDSQRDKSKYSLQPVRFLDNSIAPRLPGASRYARNNSSRMYVRCSLVSDSGATPCHTRAIILGTVPGGGAGSDSLVLGLARWLLHAFF